MTKLLLVDDHAIFLDSFADYLEKEKDIKVVGKALNGEEAIKILKSVNVDIIISDLTMKGMDGFKLIEEVNKISNESKFIFLTMNDNISTIERVIKLGAKGFLSKENTINEIISAIREVTSGGEYFDKGSIKKIINSIRINSYYDQYSRTPIPEYSGITKQYKLTKREEDVIKCMAKELTSKEISEQLSISVSTVETHKRKIIAKLNLKNTFELKIYALEKYN